MTVYFGLIPSEFQSFLKVLLAIIVFSTGWLLTNNSIRVSRDEMWYTEYSIHFDDSETDDIRHITEHDIHQLAYLKGFRILQRYAVKVFGRTLFGLRAINLLGGLLLLSLLGWLFMKMKLNLFFLTFVALSLILHPILVNRIHHARPDWLNMVFANISLAFCVASIALGKPKYLVGGGIAASLSAAVYWNGLAVLGSFLAIVVYSYLSRQVGLRDVLVTMCVTAGAVFLLFGLQLFGERDVLQSLFSNRAVSTSHLSSGTALVSFPSTFARMIVGGFVRGALPGLNSLILISAFISAWGLRSDSETEDRVKNSLFVFPVFILVYLALVAFRGAGARFVYFVLPTMILWAIMNAAIMYRISFKQTRTSLLFASIVVLYFFTAAGGAIIRLWDFRGQTQAYEEYSKRLCDVIPARQGRVFTSYTLAWALDGRSKFFRECFSFRPPETYDELVSVFEKYHIRYVIVGERTRLRFDGEDEFGIGADWYFYLDSLLHSRFEEHATITNAFYPSNKGRKAASPGGFLTRIWKLKPAS